MENKLSIGLPDRKHRAVGPRARMGHAAVCKPEPEIRVNKKGDLVESIVIACSCGEEITVVCGYDENQHP
jgi:hypothetical protein